MGQPQSSPRVLTNKRLPSWWRERILFSQGSDPYGLLRRRLTRLPADGSRWNKNRNGFGVNKNAYNSYVTGVEQQRIIADFTRNTVERFWKSVVSSDPYVNEVNKRNDLIRHVRLAVDEKIADETAIALGFPEGQQTAEVNSKAGSGGVSYTQNKETDSESVISETEEESEPGSDAASASAVEAAIAAGTLDVNDDRKAYIQEEVRKYLHNKGKYPCDWEHDVNVDPPGMWKGLRPDVSFSIDFSPEKYAEELGKGEYQSCAGCINPVPADRIGCPNADGIDQWGWGSRPYKPTQYGCVYQVRTSKNNFNTRGWSRTSSCANLAGSTLCFGENCRLPPGETSAPSSTPSPSPSAENNRQALGGGGRQSDLVSYSEPVGVTPGASLYTEGTFYIEDETAEDPEYINASENAIQGKIKSSLGSRSSRYPIVPSVLKVGPANTNPVYIRLPEPGLKISERNGEAIPDNVQMRSWNDRFKVNIIKSINSGNAQILKVERKDQNTGWGQDLTLKLVPPVRENFTVRQIEGFSLMSSKLNGHLF